ncbi:Potassium-transporting ATPase ATP-binding subunit [Bacillus safensis subsp. safensis]
MLLVQAVSKLSSPQAIARLKEQGIHVVMMTGRHDQVRLTAEAIAKQAGIDHVIAEVLPEEKAAHIAALQRTGKESRHGRRRYSNAHSSMMLQLLQQRILGWLWEQGQTLPWKQQILRS